MKGRKYSFYNFQENEGRAFSEYLEEMAAKGWHLDRAGQFGLRFIKGEPEKIRYAAVVLPDSSDFDSENGERARRFRELCEEAGWTLRHGGSVWQIFSTPEEESIPIETDPWLQIEAVKGVLLSPGRVLAVLFCTVFLGIPAVLLWRDPERLFSSYDALVNFAIMLCIAAAILYLQLLRPVVWCRKAKACADRQKPLPERSWKTVRRRDRMLWGFLLLLLLYYMFSGDRRYFLIHLPAVFLTLAIYGKILSVVRRQEDLGRGEKGVAYVVGGLLTAVLFMAVYFTLTDRLLPNLRDRERPAYVRLTEFPVEFEELGYRPDSSWQQVSSRTVLASYQKETGTKSGQEQDTDDYVQMSYSTSRIPYIISRIKRQYPLDKGNVWETEKIEEEETGGLTVTKYRYRPVRRMRDDLLPKVRDLYVISDGHRILTLDFSLETDSRLIAPAVEGMRETATPIEK